MFIILLAVIMLAGASLGTQSASNGRLAKEIGVLETALLSFVSGSAILFLLVLFFGTGSFSAIFTVPKWQLSAVFLGVLFLSLLVLTVPKIGIVGASVATISGQLLSGILIDHVGVIGKHIPLDAPRYIAIVLLIIAVVAIMRSYQKVPEKPSARQNLELV
ncbi:DMT family transporter [Ignatzschineria rhizosphaerae]|uniref:DMT family transporter n=1 Tax=Ignatzschineria rhizosphaerae TaxID=2923279 RepID=A0ABY3X0G3_9GAMM|nr:DMT family transporter [Ignatzschineria rhizosphaerae]UNM96356.1 DMT family transporter [Ignatzschineria rhizosphaerae]